MCSVDVSDSISSMNSVSFNAKDVGLLKENISCCPYKGINYKDQPLQFRPKLTPNILLIYYNPYETNDEKSDRRIIF